MFFRNKRPRRSIFTPIAQVVVAAISKRKLVAPSDPRMLHGGHHASNDVVPSSTLPHTPRLRFLDKACIKVQETNTKESPWKLCTVSQVEQVKTLISLVPIFASTIVFNTILAQLQTFSVQQGSSMNTSLSNSFHIPPASLQAIPYIMLIFLVPLYDSLFVPFARKFTGHNSGITPLTRIGIGLFLSTFSMVSAALLEKKRRDSSVIDGRILSIFWITPQFLIFGISEMFTAVGLIEFFYKQSAKGMESFLMALTYCSYSFGFYLSSVLVSIVNKITSTSVNSKGWLGDNDLNKDRLDLFYWLLAVLSLLNFLSYLFWSRWNIKSSRSNNSNVVTASLALLDEVSRTRVYGSTLSDQATLMKSLTLAAQAPTMSTMLFVLESNSRRRNIASTASSSCLLIILIFGSLEFHLVSQVNKVGFRADLIRLTGYLASIGF
ncbi:Protein NRT1/ PTR FAMILY 4.3 [Raphanus sativus]|nr:Protein NRT1/ PTR FAMILY 4.3 [Raphanus sativus]